MSDEPYLVVSRGACYNALTESLPLSFLVNGLKSLLGVVMCGGEKALKNLAG
jgi:hypothetical protein